jgi:hypothetical protein
MLPSGEGGFALPKRVEQAIEAEMSKEDNRRKLAASGASERHLFVYVDSRNYMPWCALVNAQPPEQPPSLPEEITNVWAATETGLLDEFVLWCSAKNQRWRRMLFTIDMNNGQSIS